MPEQLDRTIGPDSAESFPSVLSVVVSLCGGLLYAACCVPSITQRGYPPIDPAWGAISFLWFVPLILSFLCDGRSSPNKTRLLALYAVATAFINSGTGVMVVPKRISLGEMALMTVFFYAPIHLSIAFILERLLQFARRQCVPLHASHPTLSLVSRSGLFVSVIAVTIVTPFLYREYVFIRTRHAGRNAADQAWHEHRAELFVPLGSNHRTIAITSVIDEFDSDTGLRLHTHPSFFGRGEAYNSRIRELLAKDGIPDWSMKRFLVSDADLITVLDADDLEEITAFPHEVSDGIVLIRRGTITRWGSTMSSSSNGVSIATRHALIGAGDENEPVFIDRNPNHPRVVFIRRGTKWVAAIHEDGQMLKSVSRW